jgi:hypothetical protein
MNALPLRLPTLLAAALWLSIAASATSPANAAPVASGSQVSAGSFEISPKVSFAHSNLKREGYGNVDHFTQFDFAPTLGYCVSDHFEVMGGALVRHISDNGMKDTAVGATTGMLYNFSPQGAFIPFAGFGFGVLFYDGFTFNETGVLFPDLSAGARVLVGNSGSVNLSLGFQRESDSHVTMNRMVAGVGVSLFPWRNR